MGQVSQLLKTAKQSKLMTEQFQKATYQCTEGRKHATDFHSDIIEVECMSDGQFNTSITIPTCVNSTYPRT